MRAIAAAVMLLAAGAACERPLAPRSGCRFADDCMAGEDCREGRCTSTAVAPIVEAPAPRDGGTAGADGGAPDAGFTGSVIPPEPKTCATSTECALGEACILGECITGCGDIGYAGVCDGRVLYYCADEGLPSEGVVVVDCATAAPAGATPSCGDLGGGFMDCAVLPGETCVDDASYVGCLGDDAACIVDAAYATGTCETGVDRCDPAIVGAQCVGDLLVEYCRSSGQPEGRRCGDVGATCQSGACRDVPVGGFCDGYAYLCAAGSVCVGEEDDGVGACEAGCGDVTADGACDGDTVVYCVDEGTATESLGSYACSGETPTCSEVAVGYFDCAARIDERCVFPDPDTGTPYANACDGVGSACLVEPSNDDGTCRAAVGACVEPAAGGTFALQCFGQVLAYDCFLEQVLGYDCAAIGGTCGGQACVNLPAGAPCAGDLFTCGGGLDCNTAQDGVERCE